MTAKEQRDLIQSLEPVFEAWAIQNRVPVLMWANFRRPFAAGWVARAEVMEGADDPVEL